MKNDEKMNFNFRLAAPKYQRFLKFIAEDGRTTPGKALNNLIHREVYEIIDAKASKKAHEELAMEFAGKLDIAFVSWILGSHMDHWQRLSNTIGQEKALDYQKKFLPLWDKYCGKIDAEAGLDYFEPHDREELADDEA